MLKTVAQDIEEKTLNYWKVSQAWNGKSRFEMPFERANKLCSINLTYTNPDRPVARYTKQLLHELIHNEGAPPPVETTILQFPDLTQVQL